MDDLVDIVLRRESNGQKVKDVRGPGLPDTYRFEVGKPLKMPRKAAEALVAANAQLWQGAGHDLYEIIEVKEVEPAEDAEVTKDEEGGEG